MRKFRIALLLLVGLVLINPNTFAAKTDEKKPEDKLIQQVLNVNQLKQLHDAGISGDRILSLSKNIYEHNPPKVMIDKAIAAMISKNKSAATIITRNGGRVVEGAGLVPYSPGFKNFKQPYSIYHHTNGLNLANGNFQGLPSAEPSKFIPAKIKGIQSRIRFSVPNFPVYLNSVQISGRKYCDNPLLFYKNIVYIPVDKSLSGSLGVQTKISNNTLGLVPADYRPIHKFLETSGKAGFKNNEIIIPETIKIKDVYPNTGTDYPAVYVYTDPEYILYIPMSWCFATEKLGFNLSFDPSKGLDIRTKYFNKTSKEQELLSLIADYQLNGSGSVNAELKPANAEPVKIKFTKKALKPAYFYNPQTDRFVIRGAGSILVDKAGKTLEKGDIVGYSIINEPNYHAKDYTTSISGKSELEDIHIILKGMPHTENSNLYEVYKSKYKNNHLDSPEYKLSNQLLNFEFWSGRNSVLDIEKTQVAGFESAYKIKYRAKEISYDRPEIEKWNKYTFRTQPTVNKTYTATIGIKNGRLALVSIESDNETYTYSLD